MKHLVLFVLFVADSTPFFCKANVAVSIEVLTIGLLLVWCFRYLLHYVLSSLENENVSTQYYGFALACLLVALIAFGKIKTHT